MKNIKISDEVHRLLKIYCAKNGRMISEAANEMIASCIKEKEDGDQEDKADQAQR